MKNPTFSDLVALLSGIYFSTNSSISLFMRQIVVNVKNIVSGKKSFSMPRIFTVGIVFLFFLQSNLSIGQNLKPFSPARFDKRLKGDMLLIGNNILNRNENTNGKRPNDSYDDGGFNSNFSMEYVNVDSDGGKNFSSSTAKLTIPKPACYKIVYAGLYWGAILQQPNRSNIEKVRLKLPNATSYQDITGSVIYDANAAPIGGDKNKAYACYADITTLITGLADAQGDYTLANVISSTGSNGGTGLSAGWSIFVVYEDPTLSAKYITTYDGFSGIGGATTLDIPISGFKTIPTGPVRVKFAFAALEGDLPIPGDYLLINNTAISAVNSANTTIRAANNFFNSSVTYIDPATGKTENFLNRNPKSKNTLGYDAGILNIDNPGNSIIANNATSATIRLGSTQDVYFYYFNAFAVDIIEPKIVLTKLVKNVGGVDIGNQNVTLGDQLYYEVSLKNVGNDDATGLTIRDQLPLNIIFDPLTNIDPLPTGITVQSYDPITRNIVFKVSNSIVKVGSALSTIRFKVQVVPDCNSLSDACSNSINNSAYATYKGKENTTFVITDDPSVNTNTGCLLTPQATNFLIGVDNCKFTKSELLCLDSVIISASNGYSSYQWSDKPFVSGVTTGNILGNSQTLTVTKEGVYYVYNTAPAPCLSITQEVTVSRFGTVMSNPVIPFANEVVTCPNDGKLLPNIFLCGANATKEIDTKVSDGSTIVWEKLNEGSCTAVTNTKCANESASCTWNQVGTGSKYTANTSGQFRVTFNYPGGCFNRFYFNVYQNLLNPTETHRDIICNTKGNITIGGVPSQYEYSLDGTTYQASNSFVINTPDSYTVFIRQIGVTSNPCVFTVPNIIVKLKDFTVTNTVTQPLCNGGKGSVNVAANDGYPPYNFSIFKGATQVATVGPISANEYTFPNLSPDTYTVKVTTADGCSFSGDVIIDDPAKLTATSTLKTPLTDCSDGEIEVVPQGGTAPYFYFVNGSATFQSTGIIPVTAEGLVTIRVVDNNNCETTTSIDVKKNLKPVYTVTSVNNNECYGANGGEIKFNVTNANGYTLSYSIDNGVTFQNGDTFSNLAAGDYIPVLQYSLNGAVCTSVETLINFKGPASAITASGGVSELAGCEAGTGNGKLRITNAEGGTPFPAPNLYLYSFDGGANFQTSNEKYVAPGTYTLVIKDAKGCTFTMPAVVLDPKPVDPTIAVATPTFACNGSATTTVTVTNPANINFSYEYYIDNAPNTPITNNVFTGVTSGPHTVSVKYKLVTVPTYSNLLYENFGYGDDTTSPGINTSFYCFEKQNPSIPTCGGPDISDGQYSVTASIKSPYGTWVNPIDHTTPTVPPTPKGRYLAVNIGDKIPVTAVLYEKEIKDIIPNQGMNVELFAINLLKVGMQGFDPDLRIEVVDGVGNVIDGIATGTIAKSQNDTDWIKFGLVLNPGNNTTLKFVIRSNIQQEDGNDVAIDDIKVYQLPKACITQKDFPITVDSDKAFTAAITGFKDVTCAGTNNGTITIVAQNFAAAGFYYSLDGGAFVLQTSSPLVISNLSAGSHNVRVQYDLTATPCLIPLSQEIKTPPAVTLTASVTKVATCTTGASITAVGGGGTPGYQYELRAADGISVITAFSTNSVFANLAAGTYTVFIRDANLCTTATAGVTVIVTAPPTLTASLDASSDLCYDTVNKVTFVVNVTGGTAPFSYSLDGQAGQNSNTFSNVASGMHSIVITDSNNCTATIANIDIAPELKAITTATKALDCSATPNAVLTGTITGGKAPFVITVLSGTGPGTISQPTLNTFTYTTAVSSTYQFQIKDANGCITATTATINPIVPVTLTSTNTDPSCNAGTDGSVQLIPAGGSGGYTYSIDDVTYTSTSLYKNLSAGIAYTFYVKDTNNCKISIIVTLTQPTALIATATATAFTCSATNLKQSATITIAVPTTGTPPYEYSFTNGVSYSGNNTLTVNDNGTDQVISYVVKDAKGCPTAPQTITLFKLNPPTDLSFLASKVTCTATTATIDLTATNGVGILQYETLAPSPIIRAKQTSNSFAGLTPGTYVFRVTDANGCYYTESYNLLPVTPILVSAIKLSNVLCNGDTTGSASFTISGFSTTGNYAIAVTTTPVGLPYTQVIVGDVITLNGLTLGSYTLKVTDNATGCTDNKTEVITGPASPLTFSSVATNVFCSKDNSQITVTAAGGTPGYKYAALISPSVPGTEVYGNSNVLTVDTNSATNLIWDVYVKDTNGCITKNTVTIIGDNLPTVTAIVDNQCTGSGNTFTITASGTGLAPLTYSINGTIFQTSPIFAVAAGTYTVTVKDKNGCTFSTTPTTVAPAMTATAVLTKDVTCSPAPTDAAITVTTTGGKAPFGYRVKIGAAAYSGIPIPFVGTSFLYNTAVANTYQFEITDANGCTRETNIITTTAIAVTASYTAVNPTCNADADGSIKLNALTGQAPFTYSINGGITFVTSNVFGGLVAGNYQYIVKDKNGCEATDTVVLTDPAPIVVTITPNAIKCLPVATPGSIDAVINSGGVGPFKYTLLDNSFTPIATSGVTAATSYNFAGLSFGDYYVTIVDSKGCEFKSSKTKIKTPPNIDITANATTGTCATGANVEVTVLIGAGPFTYSIYGQPLTAFGPTVATSHIFTGLDHGVTYQFQVVDGGGCASIAEATTPILSAIAITPIAVTNVSCNGFSNSSFEFTVSNYNATVTDIYYEVRDELTNLPIVPAKNGTFVGLTGLDATATIAGLKAGNYSLFVKEVNGTLCNASIPFIITQPVQPLASSITNVVNANCNTGAQVTLTTTGGTGPYQYASAVAPAVPTVFTTGNVLNLDYNLGTNWNIIVKDKNGCTVPLSTIIIKDAAPTIDPVALQCYTGTPLSITLTGTYVGTPTYSIGGAYQTSPTFTINAPGIYNISIKDGNGCITAPATYEVKPQVVLQANLTQDLTCTVAASITLTPSGGTGTYTIFEYSFNGAGFVATVSPFTTNAAGSYVFRVNDNQAPACPAISNAIVVTPNTSPTLTFTQGNVGCNGGSDGSIVVTAATGIAPYTYSKDNGVTWQTSNVFTGLTATNYNVVVKDSKDCQSAATIVTITEPAILAATAVVTPYSCNASNTAQPAIVTINVNAGTGTAPYKYNFDGSANYFDANQLFVVDNGAIQTINYSVKDAKGCIFNGSTPVNPYQKITDITIVGPAVTCTTPTSDVKLTVVGGYAITKYEILSPLAFDNGALDTFSGLAPNTYLFKVTDANGCSFQKSYTVTPVTNITVSGQVISDVKCNSGTDGAVTFTVGNFAGTYRYSVNGGAIVTGQNATAIALTGLSTGPQKIDVVDEITGCLATFTVTVNQPTVVTVAEIVNINANCNVGAQVTVTGGGGTPGYTYAHVVAGAGLAGAVFNTSNVALLDPAVSLTWDFYAKDAHGCFSAPLLVTIAIEPLPAGFTAVATQCPSATGTYTITVTDGPTGAGPFEYSIGAGFQNGKVFTVNAPGTYDLIVKDKFGCKATFVAVVTILKPIALATDIAALPSCTVNNGSITASATGGSGNYSYKIDGGAAILGATATFTGLASGSHIIVVTDTTTNCTDTVTLILTPATPITGLALSMTPVSCNGASDGTITATIATPAPGINDNPVYFYSLNGGAPQSSNVFTGLAAAVGYSVTVISGRDCQATATIDVTQPAIITVPAPTVVQFACAVGSNTSNFATITVAGVTGGSGTYTIYEFIKDGVSVQSGSNTSYTESNLAGGNFVIKVSDNKGCSGSTLMPIKIDAFVPLKKINVVVNNAITCDNLEDITATVVDLANNPILGITYVITETTTAVTQTNTTGIFTGLLIGNYRITATNPITKCTIETVHYVNDPNTFQLKAVKTNDVVCFGSTEGKVELTFVDLVTPPDNAGIFDYVVTGPVPSNGTSTSVKVTLLNLTAGLYTVTAKLVGSPKCSVTTTFTIDQPTAALKLTETHSDIKCIPGNDGTITVSATGGWDGGYLYEVLKDGNPYSTYSSTTYFEKLGAGTYTINVKDSKGCIDTKMVLLANPTPIAVTATPATQLVSCFGDKSGTITAAATGGQGSNYSYTINYTSLTPVVSSGPQISPIFNGLGFGTYTITVADGWGCTGTSAEVTITQPTIVQASLVLQTAQTCLIPAKLALTASGGTDPYTYSADASFAVPIPMVTNPAIIDVLYDTFHYYVRDANNCTSLISNDIKNDKLEELDFEVDLKNKDVKCKDDLTGVIVAVAKGGLGNYIYSLVDAANTPIAGVTQDSPGNFTKLAAGTYFVKVVSGDCELKKGPYVISQPNEVLTATFTTIPITCNGNGDGKIIITASGGTGIIKYAISPDNDKFFESSTLGNLKPGTYEVIVQDANGCFIILKDIIIVEPIAIGASVVPGSIKQSVCSDYDEGAFDIVITGGTAPYSTSLDDPKGAFVVGQVKFIGLTGGKHTVYIKDANTCSFELEVILDPSVTLDPFAEVNYDCVNDMPANKVTVTIDDSNDPADVTYSLDGTGVEQASNIFTNLTPGEHFIVAHHKNTCIDATEPFTIDQVDPLSMTLAQGGLNEIVATTTGGSGLYTYTFNGDDNGANNKYIYYHTGDYTVVVTDTNGCTFTVTQPFVFIDITIPKIFTPTGDGINDIWKPKNTENYPDIEFVVYDRYSREVGRFGAGEGWDGRYKGTELPMGDYWYVLKLKNSKDNREFIGHFTLYR